MSMTHSTVENLKSRLKFLSNPFPREALRAGAGYFRRKPKEILSVARAAAGLRVAVPLDALRWLVEKMPLKKGPTDVVIGAAAPAISLAATSELMGFQFRASADVKFEDIHATTNELLVSFRVGKLALNAMGDQNSPMANMFKAMPLDKPANLLSFLPGPKPAALVEAQGDRFLVDLLKVPKIAANPVVRKVLEIVTPVLSIGEIRTEEDKLLVSFKVRSGGLSASLAALRR
jgi:hypothetical protein